MLLDQPFSFSPIDAFIGVDEPGADPLLGEGGDVLIPEGGDVLVYGDGGAGKTTLTVDLAFHLAAGDDWCGIAIRQPVRCALVENEGPRPLYRVKLRAKDFDWAGSPIEDRLHVLEHPWARFTFADEQHRAWVAAAIAELELQVVIAGPVTRLGMNEAGTLQEVRDFMSLVQATRVLTTQPVTFLLVHHENKAGTPSGAWEGAVDTNLHVQGQGHGRTRLVIQKARWASGWHGKSLQLRWAPGASFTVEESDRDLDDNTIADSILTVVRAHPGCSWNEVEKHDGTVGGVKRLRQIRDVLLTGGQLVDALASLPGKTMAFYTPDDPTCPLRLGSNASETQHDAPPDAPHGTNGTTEGASRVPTHPDAETHPSENAGASGASALRKDAPPDADADAELERLLNDYADIAETR